MISEAEESTTCCCKWCERSGTLESPCFQALPLYHKMESVFTTRMLWRVKHYSVVERKGMSPSSQTVSKSRPSSDPSAPLMDDATLCKKLTLLSSFLARRFISILMLSPLLGSFVRSLSKFKIRMRNNMTDGRRAEACIGGIDKI